MSAYLLSVRMEVKALFVKIVLVVWPVTESSAPKNVLYLAVSCCFFTLEMLNWRFFGQKFQILLWN